MSTTPTVYGITNCDTVKRARQWLEAKAVTYQFHDFRKAGVPEERLQAWLDGVGRDRLINRRGTTWRQLSAEEQALADTDAGAGELVRRYPALIKRPVLETANHVLVGFEEAAWNRAFA